MWITLLDMSLSYVLKFEEKAIYSTDWVNDIFHIWIMSHQLDYIACMIIMNERASVSLIYANKYVILDILYFIE